MARRLRPIHLITAISAGALTGSLWCATLSAQGGRGRGAAADGAPAPGPYTAAQAERGKDRYMAGCGNCHGIDLKGVVERAPALAGEPFMKTWSSRTVGSLYSKIKSDMPRNRPGSLQDDVYLDIVAFILQANTLPPGPKEMTAAAIETLPLAAAKVAVPNFAMVAMVGCLTKGPNNSWLLTNTSEPVQTRDQPATADELKAAEAQPLGAESFQLISVVPFKPDASTGRKMAAKGLLYRAANDNRLDVTSLQTVASSCAN